MPNEAHPVGVAVPSSIDLMNIGSYGVGELFSPGRFAHGVQVLSDLMPLFSYSVAAQFLVPLDYVIS
ncbi:hypothetical protein FRX94_01445 [Corynebacterium canis]|uniref:Uncharacterized protein n=1 Tax=Corynebacterium canis TaxID=679663 RepID=A0A5C5UTR0_9CORY|nr:hypothetical protein [Corynebacterium canis]TWT28880.1 hypothetical protein FRX94_01445 [Corynebacterium canis]WJY75019.1 hypothetical protein CCANI_05865 [Corynebacterium canis]